MLAGVDEASLLAAARAVSEAGGGLAVALEGELRALLPLPLAGLMSDRPLGEVLASQEELARAAARICDHPAPFMPLSFCALAVIPSLRLTDRGLVDVDRFALVDLFLD